jgi:hypothetical protein
MSDLLGKNVTSEASGELCVYAPADGSGGIELLIQDVSDVGCELIFSVGSFNGDEPVDGVGTYAAYEAGTIPRMAVCFNEQATLITTMYAAPPDPKNVLLSVASSVENGLK